MQAIHTEVTELGVDAHVVIINSYDAIDHQNTLSNVTDAPILQDTQAVRAFEAMGGAKDDIYVYGSDGKLDIYLKNGGPLNTNLSSGEGYSNLRDILLAVK